MVALVAQPSIPEKGRTVVLTTCPIPWNFYTYQLKKVKSEKERERKSKSDKIDLYQFSLTVGPLTLMLNSTLFIKKKKECLVGGPQLLFIRFVEKKEEDGLPWLHQESGIIMATCAFPETFGPLVQPIPFNSTLQII